MSYSSERAALCLLLAALGAWALASADYGSYSRRLAAARTPERKLAVLAELKRELPDDSPLLPTVNAAISGGGNVAGLLDDAESLIGVRANLESGSGAPVADASAEAKEITSSPVYRDAGPKQSSNWIDRALERLADLLRFNPPSPNMGPIKAPSFRVDLLVAAVWTLLGLAVAALLYFAFRNFTWKRNLRRKAMALLDADEPERSADEWLSNADQLAAEGRFREAVRCLYLACLLRLDEHGVARFDRSQTNWEHLARIEASSSRPEDLDFRAPTNSFDRVWYGSIVEGAGDVERFRAFYQQLMAAFGGAR